MKNTSTDDLLSTKRPPTQCEEDPQPPPLKKAKIDANSLGDGATATCPEHDGPPAPSVNPRMSEASTEETDCGNISRNNYDDTLLLPLSPEDIAKFEEDGFVMLRGAFDTDIASVCRDHLWRRMQGEGIIMDNPATWVYKKPIAETYGLPSSPKKRRGHPWTSVTSPRLKAAVNQLLGIDAWTNFGCGWWMVTFPGFSESPWGAEGRWHVDGAHFRHYPHSREVGLVPIFLLSDVHPQGGGTALLRGSHKKVAEILWERSGTTGLTGPELSNAARDALLPPIVEDIVETTGSAGDIMLTHPLLLHARSKNLAPVDPSGVRFMCHPAVPFNKHLNFQADPQTFSPVQRVVWQSRRPSGIHAPAPIVNPEDCDHSAVTFPSGKGCKKRKWKRVKAAGRDTTTYDDEARGYASQPQPKDEEEVPKDGSTPQSIDNSEYRSDTSTPQSKLSNESREASQPQPVDEKKAKRDAPPPRSKGDNPVRLSTSPRQTKGENDTRVDGPIAQSIDVHGAHEDVSPTGKDGEDAEQDAEILAVMGFSGFGHFT